jgi:hypothetical protein
MSTTFRFTRHGYSCNNINITYNEKAIKSDYDPSITLWAIKETYDHGMKNIDFFNSSNIYVSCLVRTWMTTILLYIHYASKNNKLIILNIVPFLKEMHNKKSLKGLDTGNYPDKLNKQINRLVKYLKFSFKVLRNNSKIFKNIKIVIKSLDLYNILLDINNKLDITVSVLNINNNIIKTYGNKKFNGINVIEKPIKFNINYIKYLHKVKKKVNNKVNNKYIKLSINDKKLKNSNYKNYIKIHNAYDGLVFYKVNKNINYFINWFYENELNINNNKIISKSYNKNSNSNIKFINSSKNIILNSSVNNCIHCVSHSRVMQQFLFSLLNNNELKFIKSNDFFNNLIDTNSWSIQLNINNTSKQISKIYLMYGINKPEEIIKLNKIKKKKNPILFGNKNVYSIQECENLCYTSKTKKLIIKKKKCNKKIKEFTKKYIKNKIIP